MLICGDISHTFLAIDWIRHEFVSSKMVFWHHADSSSSIVMTTASEFDVLIVRRFSVLHLPILST